MHPTIVEPIVIIHDPACLDYTYLHHPESPERVRQTVAFLCQCTALELIWILPTDDPMEAVRRVHPAEHLERLRTALDFDADTPWVEGIGDFALRASAAAVTALHVALRGLCAFSLMRPPGHHATANQAMGFCHLNHAAIVALEAQACGVRRVAVFDFDVHHGNGTEEILFNRPNLLFCSIHQYPCYPGTGRQHRGSCLNFPVRPGLPAAEHRAVLDEALRQVVAWSPEMLVVSAGFDAAQTDPIADMRLQLEDFHWLGRRLRATSLPMCHLLEGGYGPEMPRLVGAYLHGLAGLALPQY